MELYRKMQLMGKLQKFLKENKVIYTVRAFDMDKRLVEVEGCGFAIREPLGIVINFKDLAPYVKESGFEDLSSWIKMIRVFIKPNMPAYLYKVTLKENLK